MEFQIFNLTHIEEAAKLLTAQSAGMQRQFPLLPDRIADVQIAQIFLRALLEKADGHGMVMLEKNDLVGYMLGYYDDSPFFGKHVWVPFGGTVLPPTNLYAALRAIYAAVGDIWIKDGILNHYLVCPALDEWLKAGFSLSFGQEQAYAVASVLERKDEKPLPKGISMRTVQPLDANQLFEKGHWIAAHLNGAPVWEPVPEEHLENIRPAYAELASDDTSTTWVALDGDEIVSYVTIYTVDLGAIHYLGTPQATHFATAATHPQYRARGIGRALFTHIFNVAREQGYTTMFTDWRTTNLEAACYWPTFGFQPFSYRLLRRVNPRYQRFAVSD
ncbi:MAG: GNAT family N-acetyltransferase [Pelolinea sp.]|jgi:GNAT superfamily N-acetyltransferase|nr:GNAT family N-acetyltransferase [Pelolinea sp.]